MVLRVLRMLNAVAARGALVESVRRLLTPNSTNPVNCAMQWVTRVVDQDMFAVKLMAMVMARVWRRCPKEARVSSLSIARVV